MLKVIQFSRPKTIILENVKGILFDKHKPMRDDLYKNLKELGYYFKETILNTKIHSGIPQSRNRWFLVGFLDEKSFNKYEFPKEIDVDNINNYINVNKEVDKKYYCSPYRFLKHFFINLSDNTDGVVSTFTSAREYDGFHNYSPTLLASEYKCPKVIKTKPLNFITKYFIDNGFDFENYKIHLENNILKGRTINKMLLKDFDLNVAIAFGFDYDKFKTFYRMMTPREALNLQGFPKDFKIEVSDTQLYKQSGNSMTVDIMAKIIKSTIKANK